ncbi:hypothetical protein P3L10_034016 [Capsicum annuum]
MARREKAFAVGDATTQRQARGVRENRLKLRLKTLEEGLTQATSDTVIPNGSPKPQKTNHLFSILSSNAGLKKISTSQPRASTINRSSVNGRDDASKQFKEAGSGDSLVKKSLWASRNKVVDNADKENAEIKENSNGNIYSKEMTDKQR